MDFLEERRGGSAAGVPSFFLYGEPPREVGHHFLHLEALDDRSRPADWNIRPHAHANLSHIFFLSSGAGEMRTDCGAFTFEAPAILIVPARTIHAFAWSPGTAGRVLTLSDAYLAELLGRERQFGDLFLGPDRLSPRRFSDDAARIADCLQSLGRELAWTAPAHGIAVEAHLLTLLVMILRMSHTENTADPLRRGKQGELVARFREAVEERFRASHKIEDYAAGLGVSVTRLRAACHAAARLSPHQILRRRVMLEAKRLLLYSNMTVNEAAYFLGFDDPAYFSRVFRQHTGLSPRAFRAHNSGATEARATV